MDKEILFWTLKKGITNPASIIPIESVAHTIPFEKKKAMSELYPVSFFIFISLSFYYLGVAIDSIS